MRPVDCEIAGGTLHEGVAQRYLERRRKIIGHPVLEQEKQLLQVDGTAASARNVGHQVGHTKFTATLNCRRRGHRAAPSEQGCTYDESLHAISFVGPSPQLYGVTLDGARSKMVEASDVDWHLARKAARSFLFTRRVTPKRLANLGRVLFQHYLAPGDRVRGRPIRLVIDPMNHCDLRCPLCPTGQGRKDRTRGRMPLDHFKALIDECGDTLFEIDLYGWGEPLLHTELPDMIAYAARHNIAINVSSHLNHLAQGAEDDLVRSGLERLIVSLDGTSQETYARYRVGGNLSAVLANVQRIANAKQRLRRRRPEIVWQFLVMQHNEREVASARSQFRALGFDRLHVRPMRCDMGRETTWSDADKVEQSSAWLPPGDVLSRYRYAARARKRTPSRCLFLWTQAVINPNGGVSPCCAIYEQKWDVGNAIHDGLVATWNGPAYQALRRSVRLKNAPAETPCGNCLRHGFIEY